MWSLILAAICFALYQQAPAPLAVLRDAQQYFFQRIGAPSSSIAFVPSTVPAGPVLTSTVPIIEASCPMSDFTSTLWFCPSATATATATVSATTTSTSTPIFSPSDIPEPVTVETHAPSVTGILCVGLVAFFAALLICFKRRKVQLKGMQLPVAPPEAVATMTCWESIVTGAFYDCSAERETLNNIAILQWHDNESLRSQITANKRSSDDRESVHQEKIKEIESERKDEVSRLHKEITARELDHGKKIDSINADRDAVEKGLREQIAAIESAHRDEMTMRQRSYQLGIDKIKSKHKKDIAEEREDANNQRRKLGEEVRMREEAEAKLDEFIKASMLASGLPKPTAQTSPQDGAPTSTGDQLLTPPAAAVSSITQNAAPDSTTDQLLLAPPATEDSTKEAEEALPEEPASPATTSEPDSAEPTAETSPQDVAPGTEGQLSIPPAATSSPIAEAEEALSAEPASPSTTPELNSAAKTSTQDVEPETEDQLPSPPAATESSIPEPEEALPASIPSPITEAEDKLPAETEGLSEAESTNSTEHEQEQEKEQEENEKVEEEPQNSGMPLHEPSSMGEGAEQIPEDQEKGLAQDAPVPTEEPAATSQLTEPKAAPGPATSDDGASEAPFTKEVLPEEQTGDRETKEPTAVEEREEALGATPSDDGTSMTAATRENGNGLEMTTAVESDQPPPVSTGQAVPDQPAEGMDVVEKDDSPSVASTLQWQSTAAIGSESFGEAGASEESLTSLPPPNAAVVDLDDKMSDASPDETASSHDMVVDDGEGAVNDSGDEQHNSADETPMDLDGYGQTASGNGFADLANDLKRAENGEPIDLGDVDFGDGTPIEPQTMQASPPANEAQEDSEMSDNGHAAGTSGFGSQSSNAATETTQPSLQAHGSDQGHPLRVNNMPSTEAVQPRWYANAPPLILVRLLPGLRNTIPSGPVRWNFTNDPTFQRPFRTRPRQPPWPVFSNLAPPLPVLCPFLSHMPSVNNGGATQWKFSRRATFQRGTQANLPLAPPANVNPMDKAKEIRNWANRAIDLATPWALRPEQGGPDAACFAKMKSARSSDFSRIIDQAQDAAEYLEGVFQAQKSTMTISAEKMFSMALGAVESMRQEYEGLGKSKGCPFLFGSLLADIDRILKGLRGLKSKSTTPSAQPQPLAPVAQSTQQIPSQSTPQPGTHQPPAPVAQSTQQTPSQPTLQTGSWQPPRFGETINPLLVDPNVRGNSFAVANKINGWAMDANKKAVVWKADPEQGGPDAAFFAPDHSSVTPFWAVKFNMAFAADYLDYELQKLLMSKPAYEILCQIARPSFEAMRAHYEELSALKQCPNDFEPLLGYIGRVVTQLRKLQEPSTPLAQSQSSAQSQLSTQIQPSAQNQPPAQSTQQVPPPPPPVTQAANPLLFANSATQAANFMKTWLTEAGKMHGEWASNQYNDGYFTAERKKPDSAFAMVVKKMSWAVHYLEEGHYKPDTKPNRIIRDCLPLAVAAYHHYQQLYNAKGHNNLLYWLKNDIDRVLEALRKIKP
jgi:hypothetical protein